VGGLGKYSVSLTKKAVVSKFRVKEPVLNIYFLFSTYRLILVKAGGGNSVIGRDNSVIDSGLQRISLIFFFRDPIVS
jgi:hypothetical protein